MQVVYETRKEEKMKKRAKIGAVINIVGVAAFFAVAAVAFLFMNRPEISEIDKRRLAVFPKISPETFLNGEYLNSVGNYFNDTVPRKDDLSRLSSKFYKFFGVSFDDVVVYGVAPAAPTPPASESRPSRITDIPVPQTTYLNEESEKSAEITSNDVPQLQADIPEVTEIPPIELGDEGMFEGGQLIVKQDGHWRGLARYGGGTGEAYSKSLNRYKIDLGGDVNVYSMIIPTANEFYTPPKFASGNASQLDTINAVASLLDGAISVNAYSVLQNRSREPIYTRTDHHWAPLGAYYAAEAFAKTADVNYMDLSEYSPVTVSGFIGAMYTFTHSPELLNDPEDFIYYKPNNAEYTTNYYTTAYEYEFSGAFFLPMPSSSAYSTFMGGDNKIVRIETDIKNNRKLAVIKDSFGNALIPFLFGSFEEIYVIDVRYFEPNAVDFIKEHKITDVLFTMCTFSVITHAGRIEIMRTQ